VQLVERWILARLPNRTFFSLAELNAAIGAVLAELNYRRFKKLPGLRASALAAIHRPALKGLPSAPYCQRAHALNITRFNSIESMLKNNLESI
jgi:hypothetical protein